jgi:hypothetical protein
LKDIEAVMEGEPGHDAIAYWDGADGDVDISEILAYIEMFNLKRYPLGEHPFGLYAHEKRVVSEFQKDIEAHPSPAKLVILQLPEIWRVAELIMDKAPGLA